ncbi:MAG: 50S ribosomal protein L29 [Acidobacteriia bacterium]|nr:50S ribosomal protein L29 [Terriglobia bacterium]
MALEASKLRNMSPEELEKEEREIREAIWKLQLQRSTGQVQDPNKLRGLRKDLARVLTVRRAQELAAADGQGR